MGDFQKMEDTPPQDSIAYPSLLMWQWYFLAWCAGLWGVRYVTPALVLLASIIFFYIFSRHLNHKASQRYRPHKPLQSSTRLGAFFIFFALGLHVGTTALMEPPFDINAPDSLPKVVQDKQKVLVTGVVREVITSPDRRIKFILTDAQYSHNGVAHPITGDIVWTWANRKDAWNKQQKAIKLSQTSQQQTDAPKKTAETIMRLRPMVGEKISLKAKLSPVVGFRNQSLWNSKEYWQNRGVFWRMWTWGDKAIPMRTGEVSLVHRTRESIRFTVSRQLEELVHTDFGKKLASILGVTPVRDAIRFIPALVFGDKYDIPSRRYTQLSRASLSHSFALSGMHLAIVAISISLLLSICIRRATIYEVISKPKLLALGIIPAAAIYVWIGGGSPSLIRAFLMLCCWCVLVMFNRPRVFMDGLFWALAIMTIVNPLVVFDLRLQLSALAIVALIVAHPIFSAIKANSFPEQTSRAQRIKRAAFDIFCMSLAIQLVLFPVTIWNFNELSLWNILNIVWLPLLGAFIMPLLLIGLGVACLSMLLPALTPAAETIFITATTPISALFAFLDDMDKAGFLAPVILQRPNWLEIIAWYGCLLSGLIWWLIEGKNIVPAIYNSVNEGAPTWENKLFTAAGLPLIGDDIEQKSAQHASIRSTSNLEKNTDTKTSHHSPANILSRWASRFALGSFILLLCVPQVLRTQFPEQRTQLDVLDVGQGQAILLTFPNGKRMLIDGGGFASHSFDVGRAIIMPSITRQHDDSLQWVLATHPDTDHIRGLFYPIAHADVQGYFATDAVPHGWNKKKLHEALTQANLTKKLLAAGDVLTISENLEMEVLHPPKTTLLEGNNKSLVLRLVKHDGAHRKGLALLTGDIELEGIEELLRSKADLSADVLILPHHGSGSSYSPDFYDAVNPEIAIASCGFMNKYRFPSKKVMKTLHSKGIRTRTTAQDGEVKLYLE
ncbi:ComEC/Rec2 family competence protein [Halodesulfovibrio sp.]|jgi:competence protein ComEC|uniref:ComEC/Rec2 family competence protein n=1 Tax=Halodesulfovibrio sp. TaxID=1912772 RepID=UPI0025E5E155|nr:ComEC/Rec2 family competence protein [Halodesulfovibrio sp.]MCT4626635.1 ComEC/Rec2 family competence protein [Halodesulfovibrio sp.]